MVTSLLNLRQEENITRAVNGTTISITWESMGNGYYQIKVQMTLSDGRTEKQSRKVIAPLRGQDIREAWEKFVTKVFEKYAETQDILKDQIIPVMDTIRSVLHGYRI